MKPYSIVLAALVLAASGVVAQEEAAPAPTEAASVQGPRIASDAPVFDFGVADNAQPIDHTFVIRNDGDTTLVIERVRPTCGCTVANITKKELAPGETSEISTRLSLPGRTGHQSKVLIVYSNDPEQPEYRLTLTGEMSSTITVNPARQFIGQVNPGQKVDMTVSLEAAPGQTFAITGVEPSSQDIHTEVETVEPGRNYRVKARLKAGNDAGLYQANLRILTDHPARGSIDIPITGNIVGDVLVAPQDITLSLQHTDPVTRYIVVRPGAAGSFELLSVTAPDPGIQVNTFPFGNNGYRIQLENITASPELDGKEIVLTTSAPASPEIKVPFRIVN